MGNITMNRLAIAALALATVVGLPACSDKKTAAAPVVTGEPAPILPVDEPAEYQRVTYDCPDGKALTLQLFNDQRTRVEIDGETHVLRPVTTEDGTLFLGDSINVRVVGQKATASRGGVVLMANCQVRSDS